MIAQRPPEVHLVNLTSLILQLKGLGVSRISNFPLFKEVSRERMLDSFRRLYTLQAITKDGNLTYLVGKRMAEMPTSPEFARALLAAEHLGVEMHVAKICAMTQVQSSLSDEVKGKQMRSTPFAVAEGDPLTLLNVFEGYMRAKKSDAWCKTEGLNSNALRRASKIYRSMRRYLQPRKMRVLNVADAIREAIAIGFALNVAFLQPNSLYKCIATNQYYAIPSTSVLYGRYPQWITCCELLGGEKISGRTVTVVNPQWLAENLSEVYETL